MALPALGLASVGLGLGQGFAFGTGYGAGVRFGYEDVYPYLKSNMGAIAQMLQIPFASSGFKLASGVTAKQGMGLTDSPDAGFMTTPEAEAMKVSPQGAQGGDGQWFLQALQRRYGENVTGATINANRDTIRIYKKGQRKPITVTKLIGGNAEDFYRIEQLFR